MSSLEASTPPLDAPDDDTPSAQLKAASFSHLTDLGWSWYADSYWRKTWGKPGGFVVGGIGILATPYGGGGSEEPILIREDYVEAWDQLYRAYEDDGRWGREAFIGYGQTGVGALSTDSGQVYGHAS